MRVSQTTYPERKRGRFVSFRQRWMTGWLRQAWNWKNAKQPTVSKTPRSSVRTEIVFSLSVLVFTATALNAIVSRAAGDQLAVLVFAIAAGAFGASTSMLGDPRTRPSGPAGRGFIAEPPWPSLLLRVVVGSAAAYLFYLLAKLDILAGGPFPHLNHLSDDGTGASRVVRIVSVADFARLMAGCFLAGFAERWARITRPRSGGRN